MKDLLSQLMNLGYELVGVIAPGVLGLLTLVLPAGLLIATNIPLAETVVALKEGLDVSGVLAVALIVLGYLYGQFLQAKIKIWPKRLEEIVNARHMSTQFLLLCSPRGPDLDAKWQVLWRNLCPELGMPQGIEWPQFFKIARAMIQQADRVSLLDTFQKKYAFHYALARGFAFAIWLELICLVITFSSSSGINLSLSIGVLLASQISVYWILLRVFSASYERYWTAWGETLVAEIIAFHRATKLAS